MFRFFLFFQFSECTILATPDFYYQLCCCDESLEICGSLENDLRVDPGKPTTFTEDSSNDGLHEMMEYELNENSTTQNYQEKLDEKQKSRIICAIGTVNE